MIKKMVLVLKLMIKLNTKGIGDRMSIMEKEFICNHKIFVFSKVCGKIIKKLLEYKYILTETNTKENMMEPSFTEKVVYIIILWNIDMKEILFTE